MSATNYWYWGDKRMGYRIKKLSGIRWEAQIWNKNRIARSDYFKTEKEAREWVSYRKQQYMGR